MSLSMVQLEEEQQQEQIQDDNYYLTTNNDNDNNDNNNNNNNNVTTTGVQFSTELETIISNNNDHDDRGVNESSLRSRRSTYDINGIPIGEDSAEGSRCQTVFVRQSDEKVAMSKNDRFQRRINNWLKHGKNVFAHNNNNNVNDHFDDDVEEEEADNNLDHNIAVVDEEQPQSQQQSQSQTQILPNNNNNNSNIVLQQRPSIINRSSSRGTNRSSDGNASSSVRSRKGESGDGGSGKVKQYRLAATRKVHTKNKFLKFIYKYCLCCCTSTTKHGGIMLQNNHYGLTTSSSLATYLHWMFRVNFFFLFVLSCVMFFALTFIFAALITIAGNMDPQCVRIGGEEFGHKGTEFADAFALSWTTFSTVGYGSTYPALGHENDNPTNCAFITVICSLESFIGVLYSGFCGAILFGKVLRIQSHAQVIFSDPLVVRYGGGVEDYESSSIATNNTTTNTNDTIIHNNRGDGGDGQGGGGGDDDDGDDNNNYVEGEDNNNNNHIDSPMVRFNVNNDTTSPDKRKMMKKTKKKKKKKKIIKKIPCPVLEFRIINRLFNEVGGEIMDATLNCVANIDADDADNTSLRGGGGIGGGGLNDPALLDPDNSAQLYYQTHNRDEGPLALPSLHDEPVISNDAIDGGDEETPNTTEEREHSTRSTASSTGSGFSGLFVGSDRSLLNIVRRPINAIHTSFGSVTSGGGRGGRRHNNHKHHNDDDNNNNNESDYNDSTIRDSTTRSYMHNNIQTVDEDPTSKLVSKRIFTKLLIEASDHPFFKRVWLARHVLDETSPILTPRVRKQIRRCDGYWPESLNNADAVRRSLKFNQILVSLNGVSNVSASDVYAQKIYDYVDMSIGYQFVNVLYRDDKDNTLKVDIDLINDVREQKGGGGEDLF